MASIPRSMFTEAFVRLNRLDEQGFVCWTFLPGMEFSSPHTWWQDKGSRPAPHEGLDICCFENREGETVYLGESALVPAMYDGTVVKIFSDFLGSSIVVEHDFNKNGRKLYSIYAHTVPANALQAGSPVKSGELLGAICSARVKNMNPHLHLTLIRAPRAAIVGLDWPGIHYIYHVSLCDPLDFL